MTEKSLTLASRGFYTFEVNRHVAKREIAEAIKKEFSVDVVSISTITMKGKSKRVGKMRQEIRHGDSKKAIVRLKKDQKIELFETGK